MFSGIRSKLTIAFNPELETAPGIHDGVITLSPNNDKSITRQKVHFDVHGDLEALSVEERRSLPQDIRASVEQTLVDNHWDFKVVKIDYAQHLMV